jgi:photosynthetic reaction center cytochrome c subunit
MRIFVVPAVIGVCVLLVIAMLTLPGWDRPVIDSEQYGYRGVAMGGIQNPRTRAKLLAANEAPEEPWPLEVTDETLASDIYQNVPVLGHLPAEQFDRLMAAVTEWVAPEQGCGYCHNEADLAEEGMYTKTVSRLMFQMTQYVNAEWGENHVAPSGVTCYTCHRGNPVPEYIWFEQPIETGGGFAGNRTGQNMVGYEVAFSSLPADPYTPFLNSDDEIRVIPTQALPGDELASLTKAGESTYALMMHISDGLGENCTFCHNSRSFFAWDQSRPQRTVAWHGIRMVREINNSFLGPLEPVYPPERLGPIGDAPKANCTTCHQGVNKPLNGAPVLAAFPGLEAPAE